MARVPTVVVVVPEGEAHMVDGFEAARRTVPMRIVTAKAAHEASAAIARAMQSGGCAAAFLHARYTAHGKEEFSEALKAFLKSKAPSLPVVAFGSDEKKARDHKGTCYHAFMPIDGSNVPPQAVAKIMQGILSGNVGPRGGAASPGGSARTSLEAAAVRRRSVDGPQAPPSPRAGGLDRTSGRSVEGSAGSLTRLSTTSAGGGGGGGGGGGAAGLDAAADLARVAAQQAQQMLAQGQQMLAMQQQLHAHAAHAALPTMPALVPMPGGLLVGNGSAGAPGALIAGAAAPGADGGAVKTAASLAAAPAAHHGHGHWHLPHMPHMPHVHLPHVHLPHMPHVHMPHFGHHGHGHGGEHGAQHGHHGIAQVLSSEIARLRAAVAHKRASSAAAPAAAAPPPA